MSVSRISSAVEEARQRLALYLWWETRQGMALYLYSHSSACFGSLKEQEASGPPRRKHRSCAGRAMPWLLRVQQVLLHFLHLPAPSVGCPPKAFQAGEAACLPAARAHLPNRQKTRGRSLHTWPRDDGDPHNCAAIQAKQEQRGSSILRTWPRHDGGPRSARDAVVVGLTQPPYSGDACRWPGNWVLCSVS